MCVRRPAVRIGVPMAPKATGVLASSTTVAARIAEKPTFASMTPVMATGAPKPARAFHEAAEAEGDDDRLHRGARVVGDEVEDLAQVFEAAAGDRHFIQHDRVEHDPHDGEEAEHRTLGRGAEREPERHPIDEDRDEDRDPERGESGNVGLPAQHAERDEDRQQGQTGDERRQGQRPPEGGEVRLIGRDHGATPSS